jgi:hypothetical protein
MHIPALELALFQHRPLPNNAKVFNSWNLNLCAQGCNIAHSVDRTKLDKHPLFNGIPMDQVTFSQCTPAFIECNTNCQKSYQVQMKYWPPPGVTWPVYTSSNLTICINSCNNDAVNDQRKVIDSSGNPTNFPRDAVFANCNHDLSICTQSCLSAFSQDMNEFQKEAKKEAQHGAQGEVQKLVEKEVEKEIEKEVKEEVAKEVADEGEREAQRQTQEDAQKKRN